MKIFIVCNNLGGGGAERVGVNLANGFSLKGHQVFIVTDIYQPANYEVNESITILPLCKQHASKKSKWIQAIKNIRKYAKAERPDVIIGVMHLCSIAAWLGSLGLRIPIILTIHHALERIKELHTSKLNIFCDRQLSRIYDITTILTEADRKVIGDRKKIRVMPNPLTFDSASTIPTKENFILAAGRIDDWKYKGFDTLIEAWKSLSPTLPRKEGDSWWLKIAGAGSSESISYLKSLLTDTEWIQTEGGWKSEKYHMEFLGYRKDMLQLYQKASIFVLSSRSEGLPMVLIEAMSQGCAPVATDYKGRSREIITTDEEGITCNIEDSDAMALGIGKLIQDEQYRLTVQQKALERSKYYALPNIISMWEDLLKQIVHK